MNTSELPYICINHMRPIDRACIHTHTRVRAHTHTHTHTYTHTHTRMHTHKRTRARTHTRTHARHGKAVSRHACKTNRCCAARVAGGLTKVLLLLLLLLGKRGKGVKMGEASRRYRALVRHALELACVDEIERGQARGHAAAGRKGIKLRLREKVN